MYIESGKWTVKDLTLSPDKLKQVWYMLRRHRTLFSDLTSDDLNNFITVVTSSNSMWFEVRERGVLVGIIWFGDLHLITECLGHIVFFDRNIFDKEELCVLTMKWMMRSFPLQRISVTPPVLYRRTIRFLKNIGFKQEGLKRRVSLIGGRWWDSAMFGITRDEVEAL